MLTPALTRAARRLGLLCALATSSALAQDTYLKASNVDSFDAFGFATATDGDTLVVTAPGEDSDGSSEENNLKASAGAAYVFSFRGVSGWQQVAYLKDPDAATASGAFGTAAAVFGDTVVVTSNLDDQAYVFVRNGVGTWAFSQTLSGNDTESRDQFGLSVGIDGDTLVVGAPDAGSAGAAYVFRRNAQGNWLQSAKLVTDLEDRGDRFGSAVAISGDFILVGDPSEASDGSGPENNDAASAGAAYVFRRIAAGTWVQEAYLKASNVDRQDNFGFSVSLSGETAVIGAPVEASDGTWPLNNLASLAGAAYVFTREGNAWQERTRLKASNVERGDQFGASVAVSGTRILVGARNEGSVRDEPQFNRASGAGAAYLFVRDGNGDWSEQALLKASNVDARDQFGISVAVGGSLGIVGADQEDGDGTSESNDGAPNAGAAYVFTLGAAAPDIEAPQITDVITDPVEPLPGEAFTISARADDSATGGSDVESGEFSINDGSWLAAGASDGNFDSPNEAFEATLGGLPPGLYDLCARATDSAGNTSDGLSCAKLEVATPTDTTPPSWPAGTLLADRFGDLGVRLRWSDAEDADSGVVEYIVYRNGAEIMRTASTGFLDQVPAPGSYTYRVEAVDAALNVSTTGPVASIDVLPPPPQIVINVSETITVTDMVLPLPGIIIDVAETIRVADETLPLPAILITVAENITVSDEVADTSDPFGPFRDLIVVELPTLPLGPGDTFIASAAGWKPFTLVTAFLQSTPVQVGQEMADANGIVTFTITVPPDFPPGPHTLVLEGVAPDDSPRRLEQPLTIAGDRNDGPGGPAGPNDPGSDRGPGEPAPIPGPGRDSLFFWVLLLLLLGTGARSLTRPRRQNC